MGELETDYLVVGAGASGMAFVDALVHDADADVVLVDRRHAPGGHWLDAYPFVRLHQPSANYGVDSTPLGRDRLGEDGFYERATGPEICAYFRRVLDEVLVPTGRVRFLGLTDHREGPDGTHHLVSLLDGTVTTVRVRRRVVDATYVESSIPSRHTPGFTVDPGVRLVPPNDLVDLDRPAEGFTVIGSGKTGLDTCGWLLEQGVAADRIRWFRPRDPWLFDRRFMQPLDKVADQLHMQACWVRAAAEATDGTDFAHRLEDDGVLLRVDRSIEPLAFRGATISQAELEPLRTIERVVLGRRVLHLGTDRVRTDAGDEPASPGEVFVDCTAAGVRPTVAQPVFAGDRIVLQYVTIGIVPWGAATVAVVEARVDGGDDEKNRLCPPVVFSGHAADIHHLAAAGMAGLVARAGHPAVNAWAESSRLNPSGGASGKMDDPAVAEAFGEILTNVGPALANLARIGN